MEEEYGDYENEMEDEKETMLEFISKIRRKQIFDAVNYEKCDFQQGFYIEIKKGHYSIYIRRENQPTIEGINMSNDPTRITLLSITKTSQNPNITPENIMWIEKRLIMHKYGENFYPYNHLKNKAISKENKKNKEIAGLLKKVLETFG